MEVLGVFGSASSSQSLLKARERYSVIWFAPSGVQEKLQHVHLYLEESSNRLYKLIFVDRSNLHMAPVNRLGDVANGQESSSEHDFSCRGLLHPQVQVFANSS